MMTVYIPGGTTDGYSNAGLVITELRTISNLLQSQNGSQALDELNVIRNDQAFELGLPQPVPGTTT